MFESNVIVWFFYWLDKLFMEWNAVSQSFRLVSWHTSPPFNTMSILFQWYWDSNITISSILIEIVVRFHYWANFDDTPSIVYYVNQWPIKINSKKLLKMVYKSSDSIVASNWNVNECHPFRNLMWARSLNE